MKKERLTLLFIILSISIFSQTKIDNVFSINLPEGFQKEESIEKAKKDGFNFLVKTEAFTYDNSSRDFLLLLKTTIFDEDNNIIEYNPENTSKLFKKYSKYSKDYKVSLFKKGFVFTDSSEINIGEFLGQKSIFKDTITNKVNAESNILEINGIIYLAIYSKISEFNEERKNNYLNSIQISNPKTQRQIVESKNNIKSKVYSLLFKILIGLVLFFAYKYFKKKK